MRVNSLRRNSLFGFVAFAVPTAVTVIAYPILIHSLGADAFGVYVLATSMGGLLAFLDMGFSASTLKYVAEHSARGDAKGAGDVVATSFVFYCGLGAMLGALIVLFAPMLASGLAGASIAQADAALVFRVAGVQLVLSMLINVYVSLFKGLQRFDVSTVFICALALSTYGAAAFAAAVLDVGLVGVAVSGLLSSAIVLALCAVVTRRMRIQGRVDLARGRFSVETARRMFSFGGAMAVNSISGVLLYQLQQYVVGYLAGPAAAGAYRVAATIPGKVHALVSAMTEALFPYASSAANGDELRRVHLRMLMASAAIAALILVPLALLAFPLVTLWVGPGMAEEVAPLIPIFAVAYFVLALSAAPFHLLNGIGKPWFNTMSFAANAALNVVFILVGMRFGHTAATFAWAFACANIINGVAFQLGVELLVSRRLRSASAVRSA